MEMDQTLVERVAQAIGEARGIPWRNRSERARQALRKDARAAIQAMQGDPVPVVKTTATLIIEDEFRKQPGDDSRGGPWVDQSLRAAISTMREGPDEDD